MRRYAGCWGSTGVPGRPNGGIKPTPPQADAPGDRPPASGGPIRTGSALGGAPAERPLHVRLGREAQGAPDRRGAEQGHGDGRDDGDQDDPDGAGEPLVAVEQAVVDGALDQEAVQQVAADGSGPQHG